MAGPLAMALAPERGHFTGEEEEEEEEEVVVVMLKQREEEEKEEEGVEREC